MKKSILIIWSLVLCGAAYAQISSRLNITEEDGVPSTYPYKAKFTNGTVTDNGDGTVSISNAGGGGGGASGTVSQAKKFDAAYYTGTDTTTVGGSDGFHITATTISITLPTTISSATITTLNNSFLNTQAAIVGASGSMQFNPSSQIVFLNTDSSALSTLAASGTGGTISIQMGSGSGTPNSFNFTDDVILSNSPGANSLLATNGSSVIVSTTIALTAANVGGILPVAKGGTGTASPGLVAGTNITSITGTWPNQTINAATQSGGAGYAMEPATVTVNLAKGFTASTGAVTGSAGFNVTYGATVGSATVSDLTASLPVQTDSNKKLVSAAIDLSGSQATGTMAAGRFPALTGDVTTSAGAVATTAAAIQGNMKTFTSSATFTNAAGLKLTGPVTGSSFTFVSAGYASQVTSNTILAGTTFYQDGNVIIGPTATAAVATDYIVTIASANATMILGVTQSGHLVSSGTYIPVVSSCGTSPSMDPNSTDMVGKINVGSVSATACTITFATAFAIPPVCVISDDSTGVTADVTSISTTAAVFGFSVSLASGHVWYICLGSKG